MSTDSINCNWLAIDRQDEGSDVIMRSHVAGVDALKQYQPPKGELLPES